MKKLLAGLACLIIALTGMSACSAADAFTQEYESLNGQQNASGTPYVQLSVPDEHRFKTATEAEVIDFLSSGTGAVYFGFPQCPWCRNAIPVMDEAAKLVNLDEILYLNVLDIRDQKSLNSAGEVVVDSPGSDSYAQILELLGEFAPVYEGLEDPSHKRIYVPLVVVVVNGEVLAAHVSTVESQTDPAVPLTDTQHQELLDIYTEMFSKIPGCGITSC